MTSRDPEAVLRARLAGALLQPSPEQLRRWQTALDTAAQAPAATEAPDVTAGTAVLATPVPATPGRRTATGPCRPVPDLGRRRSGGPRRRTTRAPGRPPFRPGLAVAGVAAAVAVAAWVGLAPVARTEDRPLTLTREQLRTNLPAGRDFGELADHATRTACLARLGAPGLEPLAGRPVLLDDRPGVLLVLPTDRSGRLRVLVVGPSCTEILADATTG